MRKRRILLFFIYCDIIYTKIFRPDTPGEFFKGHYIRQNFRQTPSPGVARGLASPFAVFIYPQYKKNPPRASRPDKKGQCKLTGPREVPFLS
mgnify:CR=1 FL=1